MISYTQQIGLLTLSDSTHAGGKGKSLDMMVKRHIHIPRGFIIFDSAFRDFVTKNGLTNELLNVSKLSLNQQFMAFSQQISQKIKHGNITSGVWNEIYSRYTKLNSTFVAVRSSAIVEDSSLASWAGELETCLNVQEKHLDESIKACWSSFFSPRSLTYRFRLSNQRIDNTGIAVVVQEMMPSHVSGTCFTCHPVSKDSNLVLIEAIYGLGERLVQGQYSPDTYVYNIKTQRITYSNIECQTERMIVPVNGFENDLVPSRLSATQKLSAAQIVNLVKICKQIETIFKTPQDIEWCLVNNQFYILQSRSITTGIK